MPRCALSGRRERQRPTCVLQRSKEIILAMTHADPERQRKESMQADDDDDDDRPEMSAMDPVEQHRSGRDGSDESDGLLRLDSLTLSGESMDILGKWVRVSQACERETAAR
jgi:hypothetical protein